MKFSTAFSTALIAACAVAAPSKKPVVRHRHHGTPFKATKSISGNATYDEQNTVWSGAVANVPSGKTFTSVTGSFVVPQPSVPDGAAPGSYSGAAWVGLDGYQWQGGLFQSGATWTVDNSNGSPQYQYFGWIEWYPAGSMNLENFPVNAGDTITVTVTASDPSHGQVDYSSSTGQHVTQMVTAPSGSTLKGVNAEWIVEDFEAGGGQVQFANFGKVAITGCSAGTSDGTKVDATGATVIDLVDSAGNLLSDATLASGSEVDFVYA